MSKLYTKAMLPQCPRGSKWQSSVKIILSESQSVGSECSEWGAGGEKKDKVVKSWKSQTFRILACWALPLDRFLKFFLPNSKYFNWK